MTTELQAAAERLRRLYAGEPYYTVYGCEQTGGGHQQRDERLLIDAYLAEHPAQAVFQGSRNDDDKRRISDGDNG